MYLSNFIIWKVCIGASLWVLKSVVISTASWGNNIHCLIYFTCINLIDIKTIIPIRRSLGYAHSFKSIIPPLKEVTLPLTELTNLTAPVHVLQWWFRFWRWNWCFSSPIYQWSHIEGVVGVPWLLMWQSTNSVATVVTDVFQINWFSARSKIGEIAKIFVKIEDPKNRGAI